MINDLRREFGAFLVILMETHTSSASAQRILGRIGFDSQYIEEAGGQSGGIWCFWDSSIWNVHVINSFI